MAAKAKTETFEVVGEMTIVRWFKAGAWSYTLLNKDGAEVGSIWCIGIAQDMWARKGGAFRVNRPIKGEADAVAWLRTLAA